MGSGSVEHKSSGEKTTRKKVIHPIWRKTGFFEPGQKALPFTASVPQLTVACSLFAFLAFFNQSSGISFGK